MNTLARFDPGDRWILVAANAAAIMAVAALGAGAIARASRRLGAAAEHDVWVAGLVAILLSPAVALGVGRSGLVLATWSSSWSRPATAAAEPAPALAPPFDLRPARPIGPIDRPAIGSGSAPITPVALVEPNPVPSTPAPARPTAEIPAPLPSPARPVAPLRQVAVGGLVVAWLVGVGVMGCRLVAGWLALRSLRRRLRPISGDGFDRALADVGLALGSSGLPPIYEAEGLAGPLAGGIFRPIVVLPEGMAGRLDRSGLRDVLIHECAHVLRRDPLIGLLQRVASAAFWPHPLVHGLNRRLSRAREEACDDRVVQAGDPCGYARTLLRLAEGSGPRRGIALGLFDPRWSLEDRVARILKPRRDRPMTLARRWLNPAVAVLLATASIAVAAIRPGGPDPGPAASTPAPEAPARSDSGPPTVVEGQVVDETGAPVAGASVNALWFQAAPEDAKTGADGRFVLRLVGPTRAGGLIRAMADDRRRMGLAESREPVRSRDLPIRIVLKPGRVVVARVRDGAGAAVPGAAVEAASATFGFLDRGVTDAEGNARLILPADAEVETVAAFKDGVGFDYYENYTSWPSSRRDPAPPEVTLVLGGASPTGVRVEDSSGRPLAGVRVNPGTFRVPGKLSYFNPSGSVLATATTGEDGRARFPWMASDATIEGAIHVWPWDHHCSDPPILKVGDDAGPTARVLRNVRLAGKVTNPDGSPAPGVLVQAEGRGKSRLYGRQLARTAADGSYSMAMPPDEMALIAVVDADHAAAALPGIVLREGQPREGLDIRLVAGTRFRARITGDPDGKPAPSAQLTILVRGAELTEEFKGINSSDDRQDLVTWVKADAEGRVECRLGPGDYTILGHENLHVDGTGEVVREYRAAARDVSDRVVVTGAVVEALAPGDRPAPGVLVRFQAFKAGGRDLTARADEAGRFSVDVRKATDGAFLARNADGSLAGFARIDEGATTVKIAIGAATTASGRVVDEKGKGISGRRVQLLIYTEPGTNGQSTFHEHAVTDPAGRYTFSGLIPGFRCEVSTSHKEKRDGSGPVEAEKFLIREAGPFAISDMTIPGEPPVLPAIAAFSASDVIGANPMPYVITRAGVEGMILAIGREPAAPELVERIGVQVRPQANWVTDLGRITQLATDPGFRARADGASAAVSGRPADTATLVGLARLYQVGADDATFRANLGWLAPKGATRTIRGAVVDAGTGRGIPGALVFGENAYGRADERGEFAFEDRGSRGFWVEAEGYALSELASPKDAATPARAALVKERPILGRVIDRAGRPVEGAVIRVMANHSVFAPGGVRPNGDSYGFPLTARSDSNGRFAFRGMPPGAKLDWVELYHVDYFLPRLGKAAMTADEPSALVVEHGAEVSGVVVDGGGRAVAGASVQVHKSEDQGFGQELLTDREGRYRFGNVGAGRWDVLIQPERMAPVLVGVVADPARPAVNQVVVEVGGSVGGTVLDPAGNPLAGASVGWISLVDRSGAVQKSSYLGRSTTTDAEGRFRIDHMPPGEVQVTAMGGQGEGKAEVILGVDRLDHVIKLAR